MKIKLGKYEFFIFNSSCSSWILTKNYKWEYKALRYMICFNVSGKKMYIKHLTIPYWVNYNKEWKETKKLCEQTYEILGRNND